MKKSAEQKRKTSESTLPPPYTPTADLKPQAKKSTGPCGPRAAPLTGPQRVLLPKPNEGEEGVEVQSAASRGHLRNLVEQKIERDAHERWLQLNPEQRDVILAAAKEKGTKPFETCMHRIRLFLKIF